MKKIDGRKLPEHEQLELRKLAFRLMDERVSNKEIAQKLGVHEVTISNWKRKGLGIAAKGRKVGEKKLLTRSMEKKIYNKLFDLCPLEIDSSLAFWTKKSISKMIKKRFRRDIPSSTLGDYLKSWNINSDEVKKFKKKFIEDIDDEAYIGMKSEAKKSYINIWWIQVTHNINEDLGEKNCCFIINNNTGLLMLDLYKSSKIEDSFINFLSKSTATAKKRFFLVVNGLTENQHNELNQHIEKIYKNQILVFVSANLLK